MTMEAVSFSLRQTVFGILKSLAVRASQNNLDLTYDVQSDIPDQLIGDSLRLRQVITNLVGNAIKFTPSPPNGGRGHVGLTTRLVTRDDNNVAIEFCVMDTGIGIAKDKLNLIFDTFCQADGSTTRVGVFVLSSAGTLLTMVFLIGIRWNWSWSVYLKATRRAHVRFDVGRIRSQARLQVLLHDHRADQPCHPGKHHG